MKKILITNSKHPLKFNYYATDDGRIWSEKTQKFMSAREDKDGYLKVALSCLDNNGRHRFSVHRLILENFKPIEGMEKLQVNHINGNKKDNSLQNLEWVTCEENIKHAVENNLRAEINGASKLTKEQVIEIFIRSNSGESNVKLGKEFNLHPDSIGKIKNKKKFQNILNNIE